MESAFIPVGQVFPSRNEPASVTAPAAQSDQIESDVPKAQLRTSSYVIYVDLPDAPGDMLLVHGYTGAYDRVSRSVATYIRSLEARRPPKPLYGTWSPEPAIDGQVRVPSDETIRILKRRGYLTSLSLKQEADFFAKFVGKLHEAKMKAAPSYMFMPTYNCNLRCGYCFQDHMRTRPEFQHLLRTMTRDGIDSLFRGMVQIERLHGLDEHEPIMRRIGFFGGEPLLAASRPAVDYIVQRARDAGPAIFWAVSNATELDAYEHLLSPEILASIQITLDGPPAEHDRRRIYADGSGSFERIASNITMALEHGVSIQVRVNIDRGNITDVPALADEFYRRGWHTYKNFGCYTAPIRAENEHTERATTMNSWELDQRLSELHEQQPALRIIQRPDDGMKKQTMRLFAHPNHGGIPELRESFCSAHTGLYIFDAFGDVYTCWDRTGDPSLRIGHIDEAGTLSINTQVFQMWRGRTVVSNPVCASCRYALHCGGGCAALAVVRSGGDYYTNYCDSFAARFRASVAEAYEQHQQAPGIAVVAAH